MNLNTGQLRNALRSRLLDQMIRKVGTSTDKWKVLVVDRAALRILAAAINVNQLVDEGVTIIEMLDMRREPLPRLPAIYFITPTAESIQLLANESPTQYKTFHLFFTGRLPDFQMQVLRSNPVVLRKLKCLVELDVQFLALESRLFSIDRPAASLPQLHSGNLSEARQEMATISERLTEVCKIVAPHVPWSVRSDTTSTISRTVASLVKEQLETARLETSRERRANGEESSRHSKDEDEKQPTKGTLLIIDRVSDLVSPLLHEFSYQAMVHDLLTLDYRKPGGAHIEMEDDNDTGKKKSMQLDNEEKDPIWCKVRSLFIEDALKVAQEEFKDFLETDAAFKIRGKGTGDVAIKDMGAAVRALPDSQIRADRFAMHIKAARECLAVCSNTNLSNLSLVEQDMIIGRAPDGTRVRAEQIVERIIELLSDTAIPAVRKARLVMIALTVCEGLPGLGGEHSLLSLSPTFRPRLERSKFDTIPELDPTLLAALNGIRQLLTVTTRNFEKLGEGHGPRPNGEQTMTAKLKQKYVNRQNQKRNDKVNAARYRRHGLQEEDEAQYDVARYHPPLRSVMMDLVDDELDKEGFPNTGAVSVDSIIASMGATSVKGESSSEHLDNKQSKQSKSGILHNSAAMAGFVKSLARGDSRHSEFSDEDDGRFRIAEPDHLYVVFVVGGVCYSEVRALYEVCAKREANVLLGGSQILTPKSYVDSIAAVADPVVRIRVMLPPLPIELAQSRAARARAVEAGVEKARKRDVTAPTASSRNKNSIPQAVGDNAGGSRETQRPDVEVVEGYKKSRGLFGRKKR